MKRRSDEPRPPISIIAALQLLENPEFRSAVQSFHSEAAMLATGGLTPEEGQRRIIELGKQFQVHWNVFPPPAVILIDPDPRRRIVEAIGSGHWGLILVFPWTKDTEVQAQSKTIRRVAGMRHDDAHEERRAQCADWLRGCGFSQSQVARAVWGRRHGLRRPTANEVLDQQGMEQEKAWIEEAMKRGASYEQAARQYMRTARGSEAPASAMVRMAQARESTRVKKLNEDLGAPVVSEPLSGAVTALVRAFDNQESDSQIREKARAVHRALIPSASL
jgi:hypothetical protein